MNMDNNAKIKELHSENRMTLWKNVPLIQPMAVFFEPSTFCNFRCCYCTQSMGKKEFEEKVRPYKTMDLDIVEKVTEQLKDFEEPMNLTEFSGMGEPLIHKELPQMIKMLKMANVTKHVRVISNAVFLSNEMADQLIEAGVDSLRISMQGITKESYKRVCGTDVDFDKIISNLDYFYKNKGGSKLFLKNVDIALTEDEQKEFFDRFSPIADRIYVEKIIEFFSLVDYKDIVKNTGENRYHKKKKELQVCPNTFTGLVINVNGDISMCGKEIGPLYLGNVRTTTLKEAWDSEKRRGFLVKHLRKRRNEIPICKDCKIPSESLASEEDILDPYAEEIIERFFEKK